MLRWENKPSPKIIIDEPKVEPCETSSVNSPSSTLKRQETSETPNPAPRELLQTKNKIEDKLGSNKEKNVKEEKFKEKKEDKYGCWSPKDEKQLRKDKKKEKENKFKEFNDDNNLSSERIIIGGEDAIKTTATIKSHLPHEVLTQFEGKSREVIIVTLYINNLKMLK